MYAWATPEYLLDKMTLEEVFFYYEKGVQFEEFKAQLMIAKLAEALGGKKKVDKGRKEGPDKDAFYRHYGDKIERPGKGGD